MPIFRITTTSLRARPRALGLIELNRRTYTTEISKTSVLLNSLFQGEERCEHKEVHPGLMIATHHFCEPYPLVKEIERFSLVTMDLLNQFAYPYISAYAKFTITKSIMKPHIGESITSTIGLAIPLTCPNNSLIPMKEVYSRVYDSISMFSDNYEGEVISKLMIRVYMDGKKEGSYCLSVDERKRLLSSISQDPGGYAPISVRKIKNRKREYPPHYITAIKPSRREQKTFLVADLETILLKKVHTPYAAGLLKVSPGKAINEVMIDTYFSEDYRIILDNFEDRSTKVLYDLVSRISTIARKEKSVLTIYFHNFSRFDGIILLKHIACHHKNYEHKILLRNNRLYDLKIYSGKRLLFRFRDSYNLLPGKLNDLAWNLCPELGSKGSIPHDELGLSNIGSMKTELLKYMKQDILLLGGVMKKAQEIYWTVYNVDIESKTSLALSIFRMKYYDASNWPIYIPNMNEDGFIRRGYYGGHTDVYMPYGESLYNYDVNSLYPFVMKEYPMPGGAPVWHKNLWGMDLNSLFGFIEAYVKCPATIKRPFLPFRQKDGTLIFPIGEFVGVYYSEELKYARELGYTVIPISGYLFEKMESPFKSFVSSLSRLEAKKEGNNCMSYVYKTLMNSLYGRIGISPKSTKAEVCDEDRYKYLLRNQNCIFGEQLDENAWIVSYHDEPSPDSWNPMKNSAVQLSAAITACARMYMYPYISREDSYYTDTDSVVLAHPLPEEIVSSSVLGKYKLEDKIVKGYFLAPKSYTYSTVDGSSVLKFKGPAKDRVSPEWFAEQYTDLSRKQNEEVVANFRIDWHRLNIIRKASLVRVGIQLGTKREPVFKDDLWVDTKPIEVTDLSRLNVIETKTIKSLLIENHYLKDKLSHEKRKIDEIDNEINVDPNNNTLTTTEIDHADGRMKERSEDAKQKEEKTKHTLDQDRDKDLTEQDKASTDQKKDWRKGNKDPPKIN